MKHSKPLVKTDDDAKALIIETLSGDHTGGMDIDSIYLVGKTYYVIEFLKCDTVRPFDSHPKRYWYKSKQKFISLWNIAQKLEGVLYLVCYEDSREQFKVIKVDDLDTTGITKERVKKWNFQNFATWFRTLNKMALNS